MDDKCKKMEKVKKRSLKGMAAEGEGEDLKWERKNEKRMKRATLKKAVSTIRSTRS